MSCFVFPVCQHEKRVAVEVVIRDGKQRTLGEDHSKRDGVATTVSGYNVNLDLDQWLLAYIQS